MVQDVPHAIRHVQHAQEEMQLNVFLAQPTGFSQMAHVFNVIQSVRWSNHLVMSRLECQGE